MPATPEWKASHELLGNAIAVAAKKDGVEARTIADLVNTDARYPSVVPILIDWLKHLDERVPLTDPGDLGRFRSGIYRALTTIDAMATEAVPLLMKEFYREPQMSLGTLHACANALRFLGSS